MHGLQGAFLFCEAGKMAHKSLVLKLQNDLRCDISSKRPWVGGLFRGGPRAVRFLPPWLMLMLVITHLVQLMERRNVVNQAGQFSARGPVHTMVQLSGFTMYSGKQTFKRSGLPHEGSAWVLTRPQEIVCLAEGDQLTGYAIKLICFVNALLLFFGEPR